MSKWMEDYWVCAEADGIFPAGSLVKRLRNCQRIGRRTIKRCWSDHATINAPRIFCQNSGGCGSTYIVKLLEANGINRCFHEKAPDLNQVGLDHFEKPLAARRLKRLLRYTRHDVYFEANNRLFSLTRELKSAFPSARFIHLHRHAADAVRSAMSKPDIGNYLQRSPRFAGSLGGARNAESFERFCHYWANINCRILADFDLSGLRADERLSLAFSDLVSGKVDQLADFLNLEFQHSVVKAANVGRTGTSGKFPRFADWTPAQKNLFAGICGPVLERLGYDLAPTGAETEITLRRA